MFSCYFRDFVCVDLALSRQFLASYDSANISAYLSVCTNEEQRPVIQILCLYGVKDGEIHQIYFHHNTGIMFYLLRIFVEREVQQWPYKHNTKGV